MATRVLVVDDDPLVRSGLGLMLGGSPDIEVVGQGENGEQALALVATEQPDVVLMDIRMPVMDGLEATERLCGDRDTDDEEGDALPRVIVLTTFAADDYVVRALTVGASGFLLKDTPPADIVEAIRTVARGEPMLSPQALSSLIRQVTDRAPGRGDADRAEQARRQLATLTDRERDVADAVGRGLSNADIARELHLSVPTVKAHVSRLFDKLAVENRVQIAIIVHDAGG
ncbi:DNA-binding response regulator [Nocardioides mangrovicus]|uniref:DNA-binding response regulator n=2 Tax=Nocardioides mangrovicus TaxID=2478913 RepID=A0A3L8P509_9ACTN|nr:response regulator transcription factor [Nocardioides mangrovicus]RLV50122.1 DNA-binding response regulator [Nocardioides mangrovicus]